MTLFDHELLYQFFNNEFGKPIDSCESVWEPCDWSKTFKIKDLEGNTYFLKGTPRSRPEAQVTKVLYEYDHTLIPKVFADDLFPDNEWCWFLISEMGKADYDALPQKTSEQTAYHLGRLQRLVMDDQRLPTLLPQCLPNQYMDILHDVSWWMQNRFSLTSVELIVIACSNLLERTAFFEDISYHLSPLSPTCVHCDVWSGNIAISENHLGLLDWGDAVWGIGTSSIINLLYASPDTLPSKEIWIAYADGWGHEFNDDIIRASEVAYLMSSLIVEMEITNLLPNVMTLPVGIPSILERLTSLSE